MKLKDKLEVELMNLPIRDEVVDAIGKELEYVADDFAIGFAEWYFAKCHLSNSDMYRTTNELLEIYKKETGL